MTTLSIVAYVDMKPIRCLSPEDILVLSRLHFRYYQASYYEKESGYHNSIGRSPLQLEWFALWFSQGYIHNIVKKY